MHKNKSPPTVLTQWQGLLSAANISFFVKKAKSFTYIKPDV